MVAGKRDRRSKAKLRHRAAILDAARSLIVERDGRGFSVDELAERADVARRTVFNHFGSSAGVVLALAEEALTAAANDFLASGPSVVVSSGDRVEVFEYVAQTFQASDLASAVAEISRLFGGLDPERSRSLTEETFTRSADGLVREVLRRYPEADSLETELLVASLVSGLTVIAKRWIASNGAVPDEAGRVVWDGLVKILIANARTGYARGVVVADLLCT